MNWLDILEKSVNEVYKAVNPLLGTVESRETVGIGASGDITRRIDALAEEVIIRYLDENGISCIFIGEECGRRKIGKNPEAYLVVDSIDGTTNAIRGINFSSTSIAMSPTNRLSGIEAAVIKKLDDGGTYTAEKGAGAKLNNIRIQSSDVKNLNSAVISVDVSRSPETIERVTPILKAGKHIRQLGSAALEICYVASGQLDAYVDLRNKLRTTDIAAAMLIIKEAGGVILTPNGDSLKDVTLTEINRFSFIAANNMQLFNEIASLIV